MNGNTNVRMLMLLSGSILGFLRHWVYAALALAGAFCCIAAAPSFKNHGDK